MSLITWICFIDAFAAAALAIVGWRWAKRAFADWALVAGLGILAAERVCGGLSLEAPTLGAVEQWQRWRILALTLLSGAWLVFALTYARGNASAFLGKWRYVTAAVLLPPPILALGFSGELFASLDAPPGRAWALGLGWPGVVIQVLVLTSSVFTVMNLERTFRASIGVMRWRIKFVLLGIGVLFVVGIYTGTQALLYRRIDARLEAVTALGTFVALLVLARGLIRARAASADVYPSLPVLQGSITVLVAGIYLLIVGAFAKITAYLGGDTGFALKTLLLLLSLVVFAIALQSDRTRLYLRRFLSRHFQRPAHDYRSAWMAFSEGTSACVEQADLCRSVVQLTAKVFDALSVSLWLVNERRDDLEFAASTTGKSRPPSLPGPGEVEATREMIGFFAHHPSPLDIDLARQGWIETLRDRHPREFLHGGNRIAVPMLRQSELVGLIIAGDRVAGVEFDPRDFDLLKCIADHATAGLLNVQLSQRLMQNKELEAFQAMAAFVIHDLKNSASSLNLMLNNLPLHFADPAFRADALRGVAKTADHMNGLIGRLSSLRHQLKLQPTRADLNEIVNAALAGLSAPEIATVTRQLAPVAPAPLDPEQIQKVVTNLVLNAIEAVPPGGEVRVATSEQNGWIVLTVADNGCGMSSEFVRQSLFRPFQTTKRNGLGIGMFQCRTIVQAHGGRIAVSSTPGEGTTFQVLLPSH